MFEPKRVHKSTGLPATDAQIKADPRKLSFNSSTDLDAFDYPFLVETPAPDPQEGMRVVRGPNELIAGQWTQTWVQEPVSLDQVRAEARAQVDSKEKEKRESFPWDFGSPNGILYLQLRGTEDQANWLTLQNSASAAIAAGQGESALLGIRTEENVTVQVTASAAMSIMLAMAGFGGNTKSRAWAIKDQIKAATTVAAVQAVLDAELGTGWPIDSMGGQ